MGFQLKITFQGDWIFSPKTQNMVPKLRLGILLLTGLLTPISALDSDKLAATANSWLGPEFSIVRKVYKDCSENNDFIGCLKQRALNAITKAVEQDNIKIVDGLVMEKQNTTEQESIIGLADARALNSMDPIDKALLQKFDKLLRTHTLKIDMATGVKGDTESRAYKAASRHDDDGDERHDDKGHDHDHKGHDHKGHDDHHHKKKGGGHMKYVIAAMLTAMGIAGPIGLKALAMIAVKALVISKVALTIASIIALKKIFTHDSHEESISLHGSDNR